MSELLNFKKIKEPDAKERQIIQMLQQPGVEQKVEALAATLSETFSAQTRLLVDIRPGAEILDTHTNIQYVYDGAVPPFDFDPLTTVIFRKARDPIEELPDQAYARITVKGLNGQQYILAMRDFIKMFAVGRWTVQDLNIADEREITKKMF